jgi:uncharacterized protein YhbP (UPF0306 family)
MSSQLKELISNYLHDAKLMQLATVAGSKPWVCNVWFVADESFNIYWFSSVTRRHSRELEHNVNVAGSMCLPTSPQNPPQGLQFEGIAKVVSKKAEVQRVIGLYKNYIFPLEQIQQMMTHPDRPHRFYQIKPALFVLFDVKHFPDQPRQEWTPQ